MISRAWHRLKWYAMFLALAYQRPLLRGPYQDEYDRAARELLGRKP